MYYIKEEQEKKPKEQQIELELPVEKELYPSEQTDNNNINTLEDLEIDFTI